jgi:hypothetical protein
VRVDSTGPGPKDYAGAWLASSQTVNDVNEGFDILVNWTSDYAVVAGWVPGLGCGGSDRELFGVPARAIWVRSSRTRRGSSAFRGSATVR